MDSTLEIKSGYMSVHHKGVLGGDNWKAKWCILMAGSSTSHPCLHKCDSQGDVKHPKILDLHKLSKVDKLKESNETFEVVIKSDSHFFKCEDAVDQASWIKAFQHILQSRDRCSKASTVSGELIVEENLLYQSVDETPVFKVQLQESDDSKRIGLSPDNDYYLEVHLTDIVLLDSNKTNLFQWPYMHIKSFGRLPDLFIINTGRRTSTGNGSFSFITTEGELISKSIYKNTKTLRTHHSNESINTAHSIPPVAKNEQSKLQNPSNLSKSMSGEARKVLPESKEEKSHLSKSANEETPKSVNVLDDSLKQNLEQVFVKQQQSIGEEPTKQVFKGSTESQVRTKSLKREKEKEKKRREKKEKEEQKEREKRAKEEAKKQEKEKKEREKEMKKNKGNNPVLVTQSQKSQIHVYDNPSNEYEEVDDFRRKSSITAPGAYALPQDIIPAPKRAVENHYAEPDNIQGDRKNTGKPNIYSTTEPERSEAWRVMGSDTNNLHEEDYENIKRAAINPTAIEGDYDMPEELASNVPHILPDEEDETYDHFSSFEFKPLRKSRVSSAENEESENIYGDDSGTKIDTNQPASCGGYEEASIVTVKSLHK